MRMTRYLFALVCVAVFMTACGSSHDGELLWQFETKKSSRQWVALDEQRFYLCVDDVYCLERATGRLLWEFETFGAHSSAPVIAGERLFFQCGGLYALDAATGAVRWEFWTKTWATTAPAADTGRVYAPAGDQLFCLDAVSGKRLWSVKTGSVEKAPVLIGSRLFISVGETIFCLDASSGKRLWRFDVGSGRVQLAPGGAYLLSVGFEGLVRAHQVETGQVQWQLETHVPLVAFSALDSGQVLISAGTLYCLDPESGVPLWTFHQDQYLAFVAQRLGGQVFARGIKSGFFCVSMHDGSFVRSMHLPDGGRLLMDISGAVFFPGGLSRHVTCLSVPAL